MTACETIYPSLTHSDSLSILIQTYTTSLCVVCIHHTFLSGLVIYLLRRSIAEARGMVIGPMGSMKAMTFHLGASVCIKPFPHIATHSAKFDNEVLLAPRHAVGEKFRP